MRDFKTYNGWANYATWKLHHEVFSYIDVNELEDWKELEMYQKVYELFQYVNDHLFKTSDGLARELSLCFLEEVDWEEIANSLS